MRTADLDYDLPEALIAQFPPAERDGARMLVLDRGHADVSHATVLDLATALPPSLLVLNDTRVIPARLFGLKPTGGRVELLLVTRLGEGVSEPGGTHRERWSALGRASKGLRPGTVIDVAGGAIVAEVIGRREGAELELELSSAEPLAEAIGRVGVVPLPPYIRREAEPSDRERYQTVFAARAGAVAAPTAGLHFSERLLAMLGDAGHRTARVTLHVGPGTFRPIDVDDLDDHTMHSERWEVPEPTAVAIATARAEGRPVVAVGTTVVRTLESARVRDRVRAGSGETRLFIQPGYELRAIDGLITNFHLPRSTLLALVMAFAGVDPIRRAYAEAVRESYRFFSYGDAMLIRPRSS